MDLKCVNPANGPLYYQDCLAKVGEKQLLAATGANRLRVGDRVSVCLEAEVLKAMAQGHGGWIDNMAEVRELFISTLPPPPPPSLFFPFNCLWSFLRILLKVKKKNVILNLRTFQETGNLCEFFNLEVSFTGFLFNK